MPKSSPLKPTDELYQSLQLAYQHFNEHLFDAKLPAVLFTVQRQRGTLGYFAPERWTSTKGEYCHEISINPAHMGGARVIDVLQTLVHEMCHCWQYCYGKPSQNGYHNKEWAYKMIEIGLQPTDTGQPGGAIVGSHMNDMVIGDGRFKRSCVTLIQRKEFKIPWIYRLTYASNTSGFDRLMESEGSMPLSISDEFLEAIGVKEEMSFDNLIEDVETFLHSTYEDIMPSDTFFSQPVKKKAKSKYSCPTCRLNIWAKPNVRVMCMDCDEELMPQ